MKMISLIILGSAILVGCRSNDWEKTSLMMGNIGHGPGHIVLSIKEYSRNEVFVGTSTSVMRSRDNYDTYESVNLPSGDQWRVIATSYAGDIYVGGAGLCGSKDGGLTWEKMTQDLPVRVSSIGLEGDDRIYIGTSYDGMVYRSTNKGMSWVKVMQAGEGIDCKSIVVTSAGYIFVGTARGHRDIEGSTLGVYRSTDYGASWHYTAFGVNKSDVFSLAIDENGNIYSGTSGGLYRSSDHGNSWQLVLSMSVQYVSTDKIGYLFISTPGNIKYSSNSGSTWERVEGFTTTSVECLTVTSDNYLLVGMSSLGGLIRQKLNF